MNMKKYVAEAVGTMFLVLMGCGSAVLAGGHVGFLGIAFAFGLTVMVMVYAIGSISGCHINPAITIAMWVNKKINGTDTAWYIVFQCVGAVVGAAILYAIASGMPDYNVMINGLGANGFGAASPDKYSLISGAVAEFALTALFLFIIFGATSKKAPAGFAGIAIGLGLTLIHIVGIPVTGVSVNPARSFGPALVLALNGSGTAISQLWLFILAPVLGGVFGAWAWNQCDTDSAKPAKK
ncbi:MAG: aquaporin Z [Elusimicrobium sp.]|jgi:aquaporin Z|nr:aquaporin Z [Elusimicrobium sp.]